MGNGFSSGSALAVVSSEEEEDQDVRIVISEEEDDDDDVYAGLKHFGNDYEDSGRDVRYDYMYEVRSVKFSLSQDAPSLFDHK